MGKSTGPQEERPVNTWDQVGHGGVFISYTPAIYRSVMPARVQGVRRGYKTDPEGSWYDHGHKTFGLRGGGTHKECKEAAIEEAKAWAGERYGIKNWKRNAMGDFVDADADYPPLRSRKR